MKTRLAILLVFVVATTYNGYATDRQRPNVIVIMTDDQGFGELSAHGNPILKTPNLDKLWASSVRFDDFHVAPMCTPTRGQLLTGVDAVRNGAVNVSSGRSLLKPAVLTLGDRFSTAGYQTALFGKWHLGDNYPFRPEDRGFQNTLWFPSSHIGSVPDYWGNDYFDDVYINNGQRASFEGYCTDVFFREAMAWMADCKRNKLPSFTYLATNAPHQPFHARQEDIAAVEQWLAGKESLLKMGEKTTGDFVRYLAMIKNIDDNIGQLIHFLRMESLLDNTIIVFLTDNGSTFGPAYFNAGMRGGKTTLYEGGHRVPCFISWPGGSLGEPRDVGGLTQVQDIAPTLLDLCGIPYQARGFDGISLAAILKGKEVIADDRALFINYSRMPIHFDYPTPFATSKVSKSESAVLWKNWRFLNGNELYNLADDPKQQTNVFSSHPEIVSHMRNLLDDWWARAAADVNLPQRVIIGSTAENPTLLTACEWLDVFVDQQIQVEVGERKNSYWLLDVFEEGVYEFELRRWPKELNRMLADEENSGESPPIAAGRIFVKQAEHTFFEEMDVVPGDEAVTFHVKLKSGPMSLHTWFKNEQGESLFGAYYVYVTKVG